jgi:hypothetical protein
LTGRDADVLAAENIKDIGSSRWTNYSPVRDLLILVFGAGFGWKCEVPVGDERWIGWICFFGRIFLVKGSILDANEGYI